MTPTPIAPYKPVITWELLPLEKIQAQQQIAQLRSQLTSLGIDPE